MKTLWMKVDLKNNEQPLAVAQHRSELARMLGVNEKSISQHMSRQKRLHRECCYRKIEVEE